MYWCHQKRDYVNPESSICEKFKPRMKGPLDKKEYCIGVDFLTEPKAAKNVEEAKQLIESGLNTLQTWKALNYSENGSRNNEENHFFCGKTILLK
jgi:hypothetical protein